MNFSKDGDVLYWKWNNIMSDAMIWTKQNNTNKTQFLFNMSKLSSKYPKIRLYTLIYPHILTIQNEMQNLGTMHNINIHWRFHEPYDTLWMLEWVPRENIYEWIIMHDMSMKIMKRVWKMSHLVTCNITSFSRNVVIIWNAVFEMLRWSYDV